MPALRLLAALLLGLWLGIADAGAHAQLVASDPIDGAVLATAPAEIRLTFNEPVAPTAMRLVGPDGSTVAVPARAEAETLVLTPPPAEAAGTRLLAWRVVSADGHPVGGSLVYSVGTRTGTPAADAPATGLAAGLWLARAALLAAALFGIGGAVFAGLVDPAAAAPPLSRRGALLAAAAVPPLAAGLAALQGADALGGGLAAALGRAALAAGLSTGYGASAAGLSLAAVVAVAALALRPSAVRSGLAAAAWLGAAAAFAASGHAASAPPRPATTVAVAVHAAAALWWLGALPPLAAAARAGIPDLPRLIARFSVGAIPLVGLLAASGAALALVQVETPGALATTAYGRLLAAKLALVAILLLLAARNRLVLAPAIAVGSVPARRRFAATVTAEIVAALVLVAVVAGWRLTPPPRALAAFDRAGVSTHMHAAAAMADVGLVPGRRGDNRARIVILAGDFGPLPAKELTLVMVPPADGLEPIERPARLDADGTWRVDAVPLPLAGRWTARVEILVDDFTRAVVDGPVDIRP